MTLNIITFPLKRRSHVEDLWFFATNFVWIKFFRQLSKSDVPQSLGWARRKTSPEFFICFLAHHSFMCLESWGETRTKIYSFYARIYSLFITLQVSRTVDDGRDKVFMPKKRQHQKWATRTFDINVSFSLINISRTALVSGMRNGRRIAQASDKQV